MPELRVLHVGCGTDPLPDWFDVAAKTNGWSVAETRLDLDAEVQPDIVASMLAMGAIGPFDVVHSSHALEHVYPHEVVPALLEMRRVLRDNGWLSLIVPDLEGVQPTDDVLYESPGGKVCGLDIMYGHRDLVATNRLYAHHTGFTKPLLEQALAAAGFGRMTIRQVPYFNLVAHAFKEP